MKIYRCGDLDIFEDERGEIINMIPEGVVIKSAMYITGKEGAVRGNHYHKKDIHYCYVVSGVITYETSDYPAGEVTSIDLFPGDVVVSEPPENHRFIFKTRGAFVALATEARTHENYEEDTVREVF